MRELRRAAAAWIRLSIMWLVRLTTGTSAPTATPAPRQSGSAGRGGKRVSLRSILALTADKMSIPDTSANLTR